MKPYIDQFMADATIEPSEYNKKLAISWLKKAHRIHVSNCYTYTPPKAMVDSLAQVFQLLEESERA